MSEAIKNPFKKKSVFTADSDQVERLFESVYGHGFSFEADNHSESGISLEFTVEKGDNGGEDEQDELQWYKKTGEGELLTNTILNDLADQGIIEEGEYVIFCI